MKHIKIQYLLLLIVISLFISCNQTTKDEKGYIIAKVNDDKLFLHDIKSLLENKSPGDSMQFLKDYVDKWVINKLIYEKAHLNIDINEQIEKKVQEYREDLYIHKYETFLAAQKLDVQISEDELKSYYDKNMTDFMLPEKIVKPIYIEISKKIANIDDVKKWFQSNKPEDVDKLKDFCFQFASKFFFEENWIKASVLIHQTPIKEQELERAISSRSPLINNDSLNYYLFEITDYLPANSQAPFDYIKKEIETILLHKKKRELIYRLRNKIYQDALDKNKIDIYIDK